MTDAPPPPPPALPPSPAAPPPGWYHDGIAVRWWDGAAWGPAAPTGTNPDDRTLSILTHGGVLVGGFILPLVFYLIADDETRPETRWHAREALNFQLSFLVAYLGSFVVFFVVVIGAAILNFVFSIIGAMRASAGIRWRYPIRIPFVRA